MKPTIAVVSCGAMGAGVAAQLTQSGARVLTDLGGRSAASLARAAAAGMQAASLAELAAADIFLSILPPGEAVALAERMAGPLKTAARKAIFVDCNAISPQTMQLVAAVIAPSGAQCVDASIIGSPPVAGKSGPVFYASGPDAGAMVSLRDVGIDLRVLEGPIGAASGLKMTYGGITKGFTALASAMMLAATRFGAAEALRAELDHSLPFLLRWFETQVPGMYPKAYRWVDEMDEISAFLSDDAPASAIYAAIADLYRHLAADVAAHNHETKALSAFLSK